MEDLQHYSNRKESLTSLMFDDNALSRRSCSMLRTELWQSRLYYGKSFRNVHDPDRPRSLSYVVPAFVPAIHDQAFRLPLQATTLPPEREVRKLIKSFKEYLKQAVAPFKLRLFTVF